MSIEIRSFTPQDTADWDEYVRRHPHGSPFHLTAWMRSIQTVFGYQPRYVAAWQGRTIIGVLPLFEVRNPLMGKVLLSTPFAVYGGVLADSDSVREEFSAHLRRIGEAGSVQHVELRNAHPEQCLGFDSVSRYVTFIQQVGPDEEVILDSIPRKTRAAVRKSLKFPFSARQSRQIQPFEELYARNLRRLGTPCFPRNHFTTLLREFGEEAGIRETVLDGKVVAAVFTLYFRDQILPYYGASDPEFNPQQPNNFMYFDQMRWAGQNQYRIFDFGRSKLGSGSYDFKAHWGMQERPLPYEMLLVRRKHLPDFTPKNPKFQFLIRIWQSVPVPVARAVGPFLIRLVP